MPKKAAACSEPKCREPVVARGLCSTHYRSALRREQGTKERVTLDDAELVSFALPRELLDQVDASAELLGVSRSEWLRWAVEEKASRSKR